ncbi:MAG: hypothetical protein HY752_08500 [Nitrospirae bacterium]|nr:hypothetical protein [Nitrospirota bacterium]
MAHINQTDGFKALSLVYLGSSLQKQFNGLIYKELLDVNNMVKLEIGCDLR